MAFETLYDALGKNFERYQKDKRAVLRLGGGGSLSCPQYPQVGGGLMPR